MKEISSDFLKVHEGLKIDESITRYEFHIIQPYSNTSLKNNDEIRLPFHSQELFMLPCESYIYIEGVAEKSKDNSPPPAETKFVKNGINFLFSGIRYEINGIQIDHSHNLGITSLMKGLFSFNADQSNRLENAGWSKNSAKKNFSYCIPLKMLLGFAEDYKKMLINVKSELILLRSRTDQNMYFADKAENDIKITLNIVQWRVPILTLSDAYKLQAMKMIQQNIRLEMGFRNWDLYEYPNLPSDSRTVSWPLKLSPSLEKPRYLIVGFQNNKRDNILSDSGAFDAVSIRNVRLYLNAESYPYTALNVDFTNSKFALLYENFILIRKNYYNYATEECAFNPTKFLNECPLWCIDCSRQCESVKNGTVNVRVEIESLANFQANTAAYCLVISDKVVEYEPFSGIVHKMH